MKEEGEGPKKNKNKTDIQKKEKMPPKTKPYVDVGRSKPSLPLSTESL
jgi:hypothetical protein